MYEYIKGTIVQLMPTQVILENNGVGYRLLISLNTYSALQGKKEIRLYTLYYVREDHRAMYGFFTEEERLTFEILIGVSGVGPSTGQLLISSMTPSQIAEAVENEDESSFKSVKGIGVKTAKRLILDLKDKIKRIQGDQNISPEINPVISDHRSDMEEARLGLTALGFNPAQIQQALHKISKNQEADSVEKIIKMALKLMS